MKEASDESPVEVECKVGHCSRSPNLVSEESEDIHRGSGEVQGDISFGPSDVVSGVVPCLVKCSAYINDSVVDVASVAGVALGPSWAVRWHIPNFIPIPVVYGAIDVDRCYRADVEMKESGKEEQNNGGHGLLVSRQKTVS